MKISKKLSYGIKILLDMIENNGENEYVSIKTLSMQNSFSENYLEKIIAQLKKAQLVQSNRGTQGGYKLAKPICLITLYDIMMALEKDILQTSCSATDSCSSSCDCKIFKVIQMIDFKLNDSLKSITLKDIINL